MGKDSKTECKLFQLRNIMTIPIRNELNTRTKYVKRAQKIKLGIDVLLILGCQFWQSA